MDAWDQDDEVYDALIVADFGDAAEEAVRLTNGRVAGRSGWAAASRQLPSAAGHPILLVEAEAIDGGALQAALPRIAGAAELAALQVIVALDQTQIDQVTSHLFGDRVQLLVAPSVVERIAALTIAVQQASRLTLHDRVSEGEAARLEKLNAEVARIAEVLARLSGRDEAGIGRGDVADRRQAYDAGPGGPQAIDPAVIRNAIRARRLRDRQFGDGLFEDPAWDMMLDLFAAHLEHGQVSVSSLCIAAAVAPTTALRWIGKMTEAGLFVREADPFDRRRAFMALSERAREGMNAYVAACRAQGLPIA